MPRTTLPNASYAVRAMASWQPLATRSNCMFTVGGPFSMMEHGAGTAVRLSEVGSDACCGPASAELLASSVFCRLTRSGTSENTTPPATEAELLANRPPSSSSSMLAGCVKNTAPNAA
jgi:hypothetical protein